MKPLFVTGEPALLIGKTLFLADIHVGIEHEFRQSGLNMPSQTGKLLERILALLERTKARRLVLIGDIKHKVPGTSFQEERELPFFLSRLAERAELHIVPGNHDGGIRDFVPKGVRLYPMEGALIQDVGIARRRSGERRRQESPSIEPLVYASHGHAWPDPSFLKASYLLVSHSHPQVEFRDRLGYRWGERVWIRASLDAKKVRAKYPQAKPREGARAPSSYSLPELIVMPAFNHLSGGIPFNRQRKPGEQKREHISPLLKCAKLKTAKAYMLDGTYLGELGKIA